MFLYICCIFLYLLYIFVYFYIFCIFLYILHISVYFLYVFCILLVYAKYIQSIQNIYKNAKTILEFVSVIFVSVEILGMFLVLFLVLSQYYSAVVQCSQCCLVFLVFLCIIQHISVYFLYVFCIFCIFLVYMFVYFLLYSYIFLCVSCIFLLCISQYDSWYSQYSLVPLGSYVVFLVLRCCSVILVCLLLFSTLGIVYYSQCCLVFLHYLVYIYKIYTKIYRKYTTIYKNIQKYTKNRTNIQKSH